jgi:co-chaperonin GroES (HSP10)
MTSNPHDVNVNEMEEDIKTNHVGGLIQLDNYAGSDMNLRGWEITSLIDDVLLVEYADGDSQTRVSGGLFVPTGASQSVWRIGKVILSGPKASVKEGQHVMFPNDKGLKAKNVNGRKEVVFLNEQRIFGIVSPKAD